MLKQKLAGTLLAGLMIAAGAGIVMAEGNTASAASIQLDKTSASLFLPKTYEQYLELQSPTDIAICDNYIAISEGARIYIFDKRSEESAYGAFTHGENISKMQFSDDGRLFFSDALQGFYELDLTDLSCGEELTKLTTFYIQNDTLFKVLMTDGGTNYLTTPLSEPKAENTKFGYSEYKNTPLLTYDNGIFYSVVEQVVNSYSYNASSEKYEPSSSFALGTTVSGVSSACVVGGVMYLSVNSAAGGGNGLYCYDLNGGNEKLLFSGSGYGALTSYHGKLYAVKGNAVLEYSLENGVEKTDYEISSASSSVNRLSGAKDSARAGDLLVTADSGNNRLSVYDMKKDEYSAVPVSYAPAMVATDGEIIAAAADATVYVYERDREGDFTLSYANAVSNTVSGIACLYGKCYFITYGFGYGIADKNFAIADLCTRDMGEGSVPLAPAALAGDLYGNLYVVRSDGSVLRYTEENFTDKNVAQGENVGYTLPSGFSAVRADFEGDIFCLGGDKALYRNGELLASIDGADFVYGDGSPILPISYALGFEDDCVFFNFGNFTVRSNAGALGFPTLATIDATGVYDEIGRVHAPDAVQYVEVKKGAVGIEVDLSTLKEDAACFPFASYARTSEKGRGVLLAEKGNYMVVALYHDRLYDVRLFRKEQCADAAFTVSERGEKLFLSSPCDLYHYPCIADAYAEPLARGTGVRVLYTIAADEEEGEDYGYPFAYVEAETAARETVRGYVPLSFLTAADPNGGESEEFEIVRLKEDVAFMGENGEEKTLAAGTSVRLYTQEDGSYTARYTDEEGTTYAQTVTEDMIVRGESDALRIALIVILSVLALVIIGAYFALLPHEKKKNLY